MTEKSPPLEAGPHDADLTDLTQRRRRADSGARLSAASAASVRDAAIAVLSRGARYLPVVEDGSLVGLVALAMAPENTVSRTPGDCRCRILDYEVHSARRRQRDSGRTPR